MDQLHLMKVYVAVADEQGFAAGARKLSMSPPAVTRAIGALEENLGIKLLNRTTRHVRVTEAGERYLIDARRILNDVQSANELVAGINAKPRGHLTVTAPALFGRMFVIPGIVDYLQRYPDTEVDTLFLDRVVNLVEEGIDVGIRIGKLPDSSIRALRVGSVKLVCCASPAYLKQFGIPQHPFELHEHTIVTSLAVKNNMDWAFTNNQIKENVKIKPRLKVTTNDAAIEAVKSGFGITRLLSYQVAPYVASGELQIVLAPFETEAEPIHIVHRENHFSSKKVRAFIDLMAEKLRENKMLSLA